MFSSPKAKAWTALAISLIVGALGQIIALQLVSGDALHVTQIALGIVSAVGTTLGVYAVPNASNPQ